MNNISFITGVLNGKLTSSHWLVEEKLIEKCVPGHLAIVENNCGYDLVTITSVGVTTEQQERKIFGNAINKKVVMIIGSLGDSNE